MTIRDLYPDIKPSLNLDFANTKSLDPRIDFDRSTSSTYYDGQTFAKAEENLLKYSQEFDSTKWDFGSFGSVSFDSSVVAPDGTSGVYRFFESNADNGFGEIFQSNIILSITENRFVNFQISSGSFTDIDAGIESTTVKNLGNGWYRISASSYGYTASIFVKDAGFDNIAIGFSTFRDSVRFVVWDNFTTNDITQGVYIWGAQLEERSQVTAYTPTTDQPITNYIPVLKTAGPNEPRFDHDPVTGESKGLLIEEQRTNLIRTSESTPWSGFNNVYNDEIIQNYGVAPDGTITADLVQGRVSNSSRFEEFFSTNGDLEIGKKYTISYFYKPIIGSVLPLLFNVPVNLSPLSNGIIDGYGNGWKRYYHEFEVLDFGARLRMYWNLTGNEQSLLWGAQLEEGAFPTSYIKTEGSQVTRVADSASISGSNFSEWYRQDEGTIFSDFNLYSLDATAQSLFSFGVRFSDIALNNSLVNFRFADNNYPGTADLIIPVTTPEITVSAAYEKDADHFMSVNGLSVSTRTVGNRAPTVSELRLGAIGTNTTTVFSGHIKNLTYYPKRLPNAVLQTLTEE